MKTKLSLTVTLIIILMMNLSFAKVLTVSNDIRGGAQFSTIDAAAAAATNGDTLLIEGTNTGYHLTATLTKSLVLIGAGINTKKSPFFTTKLSGNGNNYFTVAVGNIKCYGIEFPNNFQINATVDNILIEDCDLAGSYLRLNNQIVTNLLVRNCIFNQDNNDCVSLTGGNTAVTQIRFFNCIFDGSIDGSGNLNADLLFDHCVFLNKKAPNGDFFFSNVKNAIITNNIFVNDTAIANVNTANCTFSNNIFVKDFKVFPPAGIIDGGGNLVNTDPKFVNFTAGSNYAKAFDFHLQAGSPAIGAGSGGTDIGVHGGVNNFSETMEALNAPVVRSLFISNPVIDPGGTLNIDVKASKPNSK